MELIMNKAELDIKEALESPCVHDFAKLILRESLKHDIVDSINDLEFIQHLLTQKINCVLESLGCPLKY
jgi:hypothetical protein